MQDVTWPDTDQSNDPGEIAQIVFHFLALQNDDTCDVCIVKRRGFMQQPYILLDYFAYIAFCITFG